MAVTDLLTVPALASILEGAQCVGFTIARARGNGGPVYLSAIVDRPQPGQKISITAQSYDDALHQLAERLRGGKA